MHNVNIGKNGWESFQILADEKGDKVIYPNTQDAHFATKHVVQGPDSKGHGKNWTIGRPDQEKFKYNSANPGERYRIIFSIDLETKKMSVTWENITAELEAVRGSGSGETEQTND